MDNVSDFSTGQHVPGYQVTSSHTLAHTYSMHNPIAHTCTHIFLPHTWTHALTYTLMWLPIATKYTTQHICVFVFLFCISHSHRIPHMQNATAISGEDQPLRRSPRSHIDSSHLYKELTRQHDGMYVCLDACR